jgi:hypothetical protein
MFVSVSMFVLSMFVFMLQDMKMDMDKDMDFEWEIDMDIEMNVDMDMDMDKDIFKDSDVEYRISENIYSNIRHNIGLHCIQSDIGVSSIRLSPISFNSDIGLSAKLRMSKNKYTSQVGEISNLHSTRHPSLHSLLSGPSLLAPLYLFSLGKRQEVV